MKGSIPNFWAAMLVFICFGLGVITGMAVKETQNFYKNKIILITDNTETIKLIKYDGKFYRLVPFTIPTE